MAEVRKPTIAEALREEVLKRGTKLIWAGDPCPLLCAYERTNGRVMHPLDRIKSVIDAARRSKLFVSGGYIRACDSTGQREVLHPAFKLKETLKEQVN